MSSQLSKEQKVLLVLFRLWKEGRKKVRYEDIVVSVFRQYPQDFHLKGYPEYPDTGDAVHKPLYDYRKRGMVSASNKMFSITSHGVAESERLEKIGTSEPKAKLGSHRLERDVQIELERIKQLEGFRLFLVGRHDQLIDSDLFDYLGVSVRTSRNDFIGRLATMKSAIAAIKTSGLDEPVVKASGGFHEFLMTKFSEVIGAKSERTHKAKTENS